MPRGSVRLLTGDAGATPIAPADCHTMDNDSIKEEIRRSVRIEDVVSEHVPLQRAGRRLKACCPFHNEKSPSFTVNDQKGFYHCFGCGAHGDVIRWMTDQRGLSFMDAVKELASEAGMEVPAPDPRAAQQAEQRDGLHDVMKAAQDWFAARLAAPEGERARAYLATRGFDAHTVQRFGFGYAPENRQAMKTALSRFPEAMLEEAGLRIAVEGKEPYDRFRTRLMLPIEDLGTAERGIRPLEQQRRGDDADEACLCPSTRQPSCAPSLCRIASSGVRSCSSSSARQAECRRHPAPTRKCSAPKIEHSSAPACKHGHGVAHISPRVRISTIASTRRGVPSCALTAVPLARMSGTAARTACCAAILRAACYGIR